MEWCFEDINITNFSKIVLKYAIVFFFKFLNIFSDHYIITGQRRFLSLADGLHDKNPETKIVFKHFLHCEMCETFLLNFTLSVFFYMI